MKLDEFLFKTKQTNKAIAEALQISRTHLQDILGGRRRPSVELAKAIELLTNGTVTKEELLFPEENIEDRDIKSLKEIIFDLNQKLIYEISYSSCSDLNKAMIFREACLHRIHELASTALECFIRQHIVSAFIICRAIMETESLFWYLIDEIKEHIKKNDLQSINKILKQVLAGTKSDRLKNTHSLPDPIHVLKLVRDKFGKKINYYFDHYESLSEFAHPNAMGISRAYVNLDKTNMKAIFSKSGLNIPLHLALPPLIGSLRFFLQGYEESEEVISTLLELYKNNETKNFQT